jgi:LmbE family N-acetylglucosaminyl deacetylase
MLTHQIRLTLITTAAIIIGLLISSETLAARGSDSIVAHRSLVLMDLSAHPDDEDGATLAYYNKLKDVTTYSLVFTRGEGGQNEIGPQLGTALGKLRTKETLEAARIIGTHVYFLGFPDFGYSKTARETFAKWGGRDSVLSRLVYYIRALKPDVIITNHDTVTTLPNRQHGNHQAVGITAYEAFDSAASPSYHPEQLKDDITTWQAKKLFFRTFQPDSLIQTQSVVTIDASQKDSSGRTIEQIALEALAKHRTQGMDKVVASEIPSMFRHHRYVLIRSDKQYPFSQNDLFSGIEPSMKKIAQISAIVDTVLSPEKRSGEFNLPNKAVSATFAPGIRVGLIKTYDNTIEAIFKKFNVPYALIDSTMLASGDLHQFTTIVLDLRTYFYRHDAVNNNPRLLAYVRDGGNIVCFYHKPSDWNGYGFAPYPIFITTERVTEENAPVVELLPSHPLLTIPNEILGKNWDGWVQERNIYLPSNDPLETSPVYERLLSMNDSGEVEPPTSILWARYGDGTYTYCALVLYRQLRVLNDGAVKLFFNMISQPRR